MLFRPLLMKGSMLSWREVSVAVGNTIEGMAVLFREFRNGQMRNRCQGERAEWISASALPRDAEPVLT